jgi:4-carboxymuconolactone decarboxylase
LSDSRFDSEPDTRADLRFDFQSEPPRDASAPLRPEPRSDPRWQRGIEIRREVLGNAHVDRALAQADDFDRDFQDYVTRAAWGDIWARPGLPLQTRHLLTIGLLAALNRQEELAMHVRATLNTGVSRAEIKEVLMQVAVYAGVPAAHAAMKTAKRALAAEGPPSHDE